MEKGIVTVYASQVNRNKSRHPAMAMYNIRCPPQLFNRLDNTPGEEERTFIVVFKFISGSIGNNMLSLEIIIIIDEINLHSGTLDRSNLYNKRMISVVNNQVHPGKPYYLMKLIPPLINTSVPGHKSTDLLPLFLNSLGQIPSDL